MIKKREILNEKQLFCWYEEYFSQLYNYGSKFTTDKDLVKDCIQEIFIHLKTNHKLISNIKKPKVYLYTSLRRKILQEITKENRLVSVDTIQGNFELELSKETELIHQQTMLEYQELLTQAIAKLTLRQKEAIYLKFYESLSYQEIADTMSLQDVKSARNLVYKAINELKNNFKLKNILVLISTLFLLLAV